jgi:tetratricopeptide (TPR) repeat protein
LYRSLLELAKLKVLEKDFEAALAYLGRFLSRRTDDPEALLLKGDILAALHRYTEALQIYKTLFRTDPENVALLVRMGLCHRKRGETAVAQDYWRKAYQASPDNPDAAFYHLGLERVASVSSLT